MIRLICKKTLSCSIHGLCFTKYFLRPISEMSSFTDSRSHTVSYLQNSCGLSLDSAISVSEKLLIVDTEKADTILQLVRTQGLTQSQIANIITTRPTLLLASFEDKLRPNMELLESLGLSRASRIRLLCKDPRVLDSHLVESVELFRTQCFSDKKITSIIMRYPTLLYLNPNKNLKPKLDFFKAMGFADDDVAKLLSTHPYILLRSLENYIIPCFQVLKRVLGTDENVLKIMKSGYWILKFKLEEVLEPNISVLESLGVPKPIIVRLFMIHPRSLLLSSQRIREIFDEVLKLGFNPNTLYFALAFRSMAVINKNLWNQKLEAYKSFGLSEEQVYSAFRRQPMCMLISLNKIKKLMSFFTQNLHIEPSVICKNLDLLHYSLEKRIIPRCSVLQLLMSTGVLKKDVNVVYYFQMSEEKFVEKVVRKYEIVCPDIVEASKGMIEFQGFPVISKTTLVAN